MTTKDFQLYEIYKKDFYPRLTNFKLFEEQKGIDKYSTVRTLEGEVIDMKALSYDIESACNIMTSKEPLLGPYFAELIKIYTWSVKTMATDGNRIFINPKFGNDLSFDGKLFVLMHEVYHVLLLHMDRAKKFDNFTQVNIAGDYEINVLLIDDMPEHFSENLVVKELHGLLKTKYRGMSMEEIYEELKKHPEDMPQPPKKTPKKPPKIVKKPLQVGDRVRIKSAGKKGIVKAVNPDGTYEIDVLNESIVFERLFNLLFEKYTRDDLVKLVPADDGGEDGDGPEPPEIEETETEDDDNGEDKKPPQGPGPEGPWVDDPNEQQGEGEGQGQGEGDQQQGEGQGEGDETSEDREYAESLGGDYDPTNLGGVLPKKVADEIAQKEGYGETNDGADEAARNQQAQKILKELEKYNSNSGKTGGKGAGGGFSNLRKSLSRLIHGDVDWATKLREYIGNAIAPESELLMGNKKYLHQGDFRQDNFRKRTALRNIFVAVDMSGSMYSIPNFVSRIVGEINKIVFEYPIREVVVGYFTSIMHLDTVDVITSASEEDPYIPENLPSSGGTDFRVVFDWIEREYDDNAQLLIIFSDGEDKVPEPPEYSDKIIWVIYNSPDWKPGYGEVVHITKK